MKLSGIQRLVYQACERYSLFMPESRCVIGLSGGKDSMALLSVLASMKDYLGINIAAAVFVNNSYDLQPKSLPAVIIDYIGSLGIEYVETGSVCSAGEAVPLTCYRCSQLRRKALLQITSNLGADTLCLAHTQDDAAETVLKEILEKGTAETLVPLRNYFGTINVVRPFILVPEDAVKRYAANHSLPVYENPCPLSRTSKRSRVREISALCKKYFPESVRNLVKTGEKSV